MSRIDSLDPATKEALRARLRERLRTRMADRGMPNRPPEPVQSSPSDVDLAMQGVPVGSNPAVQVGQDVSGQRVGDVARSGLIGFGESLPQLVKGAARLAQGALAFQDNPISALGANVGNAIAAGGQVLGGPVGRALPGGNAVQQYVPGLAPGMEALGQSIVQNARQMPGRGDLGNQVSQQAMGNIADLAGAVEGTINTLAPARSKQPFTPEWFARGIANSAPMMATSVGLGAVGGPVAGLAPVGLLEAGGAASGIYDTLKRQGVSDEDAAAEAFMPSIGVGIANAFIEQFGVQGEVANALAKREIKRMLPTLMKTGGEESGEEVAQGLVGHAGDALGTGAAPTVGEVASQAGQDAALAGVMGLGFGAPVVISENMRGARGDGLDSAPEVVDETNIPVESNQTPPPVEPVAPTTPPAESSLNEPVSPPGKQGVISEPTDPLATLVSGEVGAVVVPDGASIKQPTGMRTIQSGGNVVVFNPSVYSRAQVREAIKDGRLNDLLAPVQRTEAVVQPPAQTEQAVNQPVENVESGVPTATDGVAPIDSAVPETQTPTESVPLSDQQVQPEVAGPVEPESKEVSPETRSPQTPTPAVESSENPSPTPNYDIEPASTNESGSLTSPTPNYSAMSYAEVKEAYQARTGKVAPKGMRRKAMVAEMAEVTRPQQVGTEDQSQQVVQTSERDIVPESPVPATATNTRVVPSADSTPIEVDETVVMHSPHTDNDTVVNYRGRYEDKAVVVTDRGMQMSVPHAWIRKQGTPYVAPKVEDAPTVSRPAEPQPSKPTKNPAKMNRSELIEEAKRFISSDYISTTGVRVPWERRTDKELRDSIRKRRDEVARSEEMERERQKARPYEDAVKTILESAGQSWRSAGKATADAHGVRWEIPSDTSRGEAGYYLAKRLREKGVQIDALSPPGETAPASETPNYASMTHAELKQAYQARTGKVAPKGMRRKAMVAELEARQTSDTQADPRSEQAPIGSQPAPSVVRQDQSPPPTPVPRPRESASSPNANVSVPSPKSTRELWENKPFAAYSRDYGSEILFTPSVNQPGKWQVTRFDKNGRPSGDSVYPSWDVAVSTESRYGLDMNTARDPSKENKPTDDLLVTLADGRVFPSYKGEAMSWNISLTAQDAQEGYPRARAVIRAMKVHRPEQLQRERDTMLRGTADRMFGHNARGVLKLIDEELSRGSPQPPTQLGKTPPASNLTTVPGTPTTVGEKLPPVAENQPSSGGKSATEVGEGEGIALSMANLYEMQAQKDEGGRGLAVGAENINYRWKADAIRSVIRKVKYGMSLEEAASSTKDEAREWIKRHNDQRPKDINWKRWEGSVDGEIDNTVARLASDAAALRSGRVRQQEEQRSSGHHASTQEKPSQPENQLRRQDHQRSEKSVSVSSINDSTKQKRAKSGGEYGPNGEWYPGGAFIATTDMPKRQRQQLERAKTGRVQVDVNKWEVPEPGMLSIMDRLGGTAMGPTGKVNEQYLENLSADGTPQEWLDQAREAARRFRNGERWLPVTEFHQLSGASDLMRMLAGGKPIPGAVADKLPEWARKLLTEYSPTPAPSQSADTTKGPRTTKEELEASREKVAQSRGKRYADKMQSERQRLFLENGITDELHEYRVAGYVTRSNDGKYSLYPVAGTDSSKWRLTDPIDVTDQYTTKDQVPETKEPESVQRWDVYPVNVKGRGVMYAVRESDNPRGGGDTIHETEEKAREYATQAKERDEKNAAYRERERSQQSEKEAREAKAKAERDDIDGFASDVPVMQRGKIIQTLNGLIRVDGDVATVKEHVRRMVKDGAELSTRQEPKIKPMSRTAWNRADNRQQQAHEKKMKEAGNKTVYLVDGRDMGKTAYDYAKFLMEKPATAPDANSAARTTTEEKSNVQVQEGRQEEAAPLLSNDDKRANGVSEKQTRSSDTPTARESDTSSEKQGREGDKEREKYPDGRLKPVVGDDVHQTVPGFGGSAAYIYGTVYSAKDGKLRVRTTGSASFLGSAPSGRTYPLTPQWTVSKDPEIERRRQAREDKERAEKESQKKQRDDEESATIASVQRSIAAGEKQVNESTPEGAVVNQHDGGEPRRMILDRNDKYGAYTIEESEIGQAARGISRDRITDTGERIDISAARRRSAARYLETVSDDELREFVGLAGDAPETTDRDATWDKQFADLIRAEAKKRGVATTTPAPKPAAAPTQKTQENAKESPESKLRRLKAKQYKTNADEINIFRLEGEIKADPSKWAPGDGVGYYAGPASTSRRGSQVNRGFRVMEVDNDSKMALITQVSDTGLTTSGGDIDRIGDQWIHVADLVRDRNYDVPTPTLASRIDAKIEDIQKRRSARRIPRGRNTGGDLITAEIIDMASIAALRALKAGVKGTESIRGVVESVLKQFQIEGNVDTVLPVAEHFVSLGDFDKIEAAIDEADRSGVLPKAKESPKPTSIPREAAEADTTLTSARKDWTNRDREAMGLEAHDNPQSRTWLEAMQQARDEKINEPDNANALVAEVNAKPRALSDVETAGLVDRATSLKNQHRDLMDRIGKATDDAEITDLAAKASRIEQDFDATTTALRKSGTEKGRALAAQKLTINQDFELVSVKNRAKAAKGSALTAEQEAKFAEQTKKLEELTSRVAQLEKELAEGKAMQAVKTHKAASRMTAQERQSAKIELANKINAMLKAGCS